MDFAVSCPLVRYGRLLFGFCPSTRTFVPCFLRTPPRGGSPCIITRPSPPSGRAEDFHLQVTEHAQHTTKPLVRRALRVGWTRRGEVADIVWVTEKGDSCDPFTQDDAGGTPAPQLLRDHDSHVLAVRNCIRPPLWPAARSAPTPHSDE